jgi:hypothetical protein
LPRRLRIFLTLTILGAPLACANIAKIISLDFDIFTTAGRNAAFGWLTASFFNRRIVSAAVALRESLSAGK